jgi:hypothetical protein
MSPNSVLHALRRGGSASASLGAIVLAVLVPKCPLCVAAMLSAVGIGAAAAHHLATMVRAAAFIVAAAVVIAALWLEWRRAHPPCCRRA